MDKNVNYSENFFSFHEIYKIIKHLNLSYTKEETFEIMEELGLNKYDKIKVDNLVHRSKNYKRNSKYSVFYEHILNLFETPSERIIQILAEAKEKLSLLNEEKLSNDIDWVLKRINNDDIYNLNMNSISDILKFNDTDMEDTMKILTEYSSDNFNKNKKTDLKTAKKLSVERLKESMDNSSSHSIRKSVMIRDVNVSNFSLSPEIFHTKQVSLNKFSIIPDSQNMSIRNNLSSNEIIDKFYDKEDILNIDSFYFNVFEYSNEFGRENTLINISDYIINKYSLFCIIKKSIFTRFIDKIRVGYNPLLPYHNDLHAVDVLQVCYHLSSILDLRNEMDLSFIDMFGFFIAAIIHDYKHPGLNNNYLINKRAALAIKYNDISVLESYHVSSAFKVMSHPSSNIFSELQVEEYRVIRKRIVECVLATDMAKHTKSQTFIKIKLDQFKELDQNKNLYNLIHNLSDESKFDRQQEILNFLIHCADISNTTKDFSVCKIWTEKVMEEFFSQGDLEKNEKLPVSFLCDRNTTNIPKSQINFISNIVKPCFKVLYQLSPRTQLYMDNLEKNLESWKNLEN